MVRQILRTVAICREAFTPHLEQSRQHLPRLHTPVTTGSPIIGTHPPSQFPIQGDSQLRNLTPLFFNENYRHRVFFAAGLSVVNAGSSLAVLDI